jgi:hypothetical protein
VSNVNYVTFTIVLVLFLFLVLPNGSWVHRSGPLGATGW